MSGFGLIVLIATYATFVVLVGFKAGAWAALLAAAMFGFGCFFAFLTILSLTFGCEGNALKGLYNCPEGISESLAFRGAALIGHMALWGAILSIPVALLAFVAALISMFPKRN